MSASVNIVIPMAGAGSRFVNAGYKTPKPFLDVGGVTMIERVLGNLDYPDAHFILLAREDHLQAERDTVAAIEREYSVTFLSVDKLTEGTACTVLLARKMIDNQTPLLIANSDQLVDCSMYEFISDSKDRSLDGSILCFEDPELDPKWSFAKTDERGLVVEVKEKVAISSVATVGIYYFERGSDYVDAAIDMIVNNDRVGNEFYTCPVYNYAIANGLSIGIYMIQPEEMHGLGTPDDLDLYLDLYHSDKR